MSGEYLDQWWNTSEKSTNFAGEKIQFLMLVPKHLVVNILIVLLSTLW